MENSTTIRDIPTLRPGREGIPEDLTKTKDISIARRFTDDFSTARSSTEDISTARTPTSDISTARSSTEDISTSQDIIIKCNLEKMTKSFFQDYVIVWHDPNINSLENQKYFVQLKKFCDVFTFTEWQKARDFIQSTHQACHVVTSGKDGELLVKEVSSTQNVASIYIFCKNKEYHSAWTKNYPQVSCVETDIESLLSQIQHNLLSWYKQASSLKLNLPAFAPFFNETDKSQMNNLHRFLKVIPNFRNRLQAKNDFLNISKAIYSDPKNTKAIADFEQSYNDYDKEQTLRWYSQESFLYKVTNNCLRIATSHSIQYCRLLLQDIQKAIKEQYQTKSKNFSGLLYRGAYLSQEEWSSLKRNLNREIEMHGFLSVSKVKNIGLNFMKADPSKKVFITIIVPKGPDEEEQGFAEMEEFSEYPQEKEILFNVRSRFLILETEDEGPYRHLVLLYGAQGFRKFLTEQSPFLEVSIMDQISCYHCKATSSQMFFLSLISPEKQIYFCNKCIDNNFAPFLCVSPVEKKIKRKIRGCLLTISYTTDFPFYGYECSKCQASKQEHYFLCTDCSEGFCQSCFENNSIDCTSGHHNFILETHPFGFWSQSMSENELNHFTWQNDSIITANDLFQQGEMYIDSLLYDEAIEYYTTYIQQNQPKGQDENLAISYNKLGVAFQKKVEAKKALEYFFKSIDIQKSISEENHINIARSYMNIALTYQGQGEYQKALESSLKALEISQILYDDNHPEIATFSNIVGLIYSSQGDYEKALEYSLKSLDIRKSIYGENHLIGADCYMNIGLIYSHQGDDKNALESFFQCLDISKSMYGDSRPEIAEALNGAGIAYLRQGEYEKALDYFFEALDIANFIFGENHEITCDFYNNIGATFLLQGKYEKALEYCSKSLDISKSIYGDNHPDLANAYNNIGLIYRHQRDHKKALEFCEKSLEIAKSIYGDNHPYLANTYNNFGLLYHDLGDRKNALESYLKSLDIAFSAYGENHPVVATCFKNIGLVFHDDDEKYDLALDCYFQSVEINISVYGDIHPEIASTYQSIGDVYYKLKQYKKALEYFSKARDIFKSFYGEDHLETIDAQEKVLSVQSLDQVVKKETSKNKTKKCWKKIKIRPQKTKQKNMSISISKLREISNSVQK